MAQIGVNEVIGTETYLDVTKYGVVEGPSIAHGGIVDPVANWQAWQALESGRQPVQWIDIPPGQYCLSQPVACQWLIKLCGAGINEGDVARHTATFIQGNFVGPLFYQATPVDSSCIIQGIGLNNQGGDGLWLDKCNGAYIDGLGIKCAGNGVVIGGRNPTNNEIRITDLNAYGDPAAWPNACAIKATGMGRLDNARLSNYPLGAQLANTWSIDRFDSQCCATSVIFGLDPNGNVFSCHGTIRDASWEACGYSLVGYPGSSIIMDACSIKGEVQPYPGGSIVGIDLSRGASLDARGLGIAGGNFSVACVNLNHTGMRAGFRLHNIKNLQTGVPSFIFPTDRTNILFELPASYNP